MCILTIRSPSDKPQRYILKPGINTLGRNSDHDVVVDDESTSRSHAEFHYDQDTGIVIIRDLGSTNGTFVNKKRIDQPQRVRPDDQIRIGNYVLSLSFQENKTPHRLPAVPMSTHRITRDLLLEALDRNAVLLYEVANELNGVSDLSTTLAAVSALVQRATGADQAMMVMVDKGGQPQTPGIPAKIARLAVEQRSAVIIRDVRVDPGLVENSEALGIQSVLCVPVMVGEAVIAAIYAAASDSADRPLDKPDLQLAVAISHQAALTVQRIRQIERLHATRAIAMTISDSLDLRVTLDVFLDQVIRQLGMDAADILLLNTNTQTLEFAAGRGFRDDSIEATCLELGEGHAGQAARERCTIYVPNLIDVPHNLARNQLLESEGFVSYFSVPLIAKGQVKGVLEVFHRAALAPDPDWPDFLETLAAQAAIAIDKAQLYEETQDRAHQLQTLTEVAQALTSTLDLDQLLQQILDSAVELLDCEAGSLFLTEEATGDHVFRVTVGAGEELIGTRVPAGKGLVGAAAANNEPIMVNDAQKDERWFAGADEETGFVTRAVLAAPLRGAKHIAGVIEVINKGHDLPFTAADQTLLLAFGSHAAVAIENARLFTEVEQRALELSTMLEAAKAASSTLDLDEVLVLIAEQLVKATGVDGCTLSRWDMEANTLVTWTEWQQDNFRHYADSAGATYALDDYPVSRAVLEKRQPLAIRVNDPDADPAEVALMRQNGELSLLMLPLAAGKRVIGLVELGDSKRERDFSSEELRLGQALADQAAIAIENARLFDGTRRRVQRLAALRNIDMAITSSLDLRVTLDVLLDQVTSKLGIHAADVLLLNSHTHVLERAAGRGFHTGILRHTRLRLGEGYAGRAALERSTISIPNLAASADGLAHAPLLGGENFAAYYAVPLIAKGHVKGVLEIFHRAPLDPDPEWMDFLETLAGQAAIAIDNTQMFDDLQRSNAELALAYDTTLEGWVRALDLRDKETEGHTQRVTELTLRLASAMSVGEAELVQVRRGALLHDIGKMGIPDSILLKPGPLTGEEWIVMRKHPVYAYKMLSPIDYLRPALDIPYCHHEKWDGSGYPRELRADQIPLAARIFAVVDVWDALRSDRPYRQAWPEEKVRTYISAQAGKHFDPQVVEIFLALEDALTAEVELSQSVTLAGSKLAIPWNVQTQSRLKN